MPQSDAATGRWLSIIGINEDGLDGLSSHARQLIGAADVIFGGARHLCLAAPLAGGERRRWPSPFDVAPVLAERGRRVVVLASGDPMCHGVGAVLLRQVGTDEARVLPAPSSFSLAAARLGWAVQDCVALSLHARPVALLRPHLHPGTRILALTSGAESPEQAARLLRDHGFGASRIVVLEALGGRRERVRFTTAAEFLLGDIDALNVLGIEVAAEPHARILPLTPGLEDALFEHDGQITKRTIRAMTVAALAPRRGEMLWDIGAGSGSIAIEWMLADPSLRAVAIEKQPERLSRIRRNALACGVPDLALVQGEAPAALAALAPPDAIFIGGGVSNPALLDAARGALHHGGRLVANAVTLEAEAELLRRHACLGGELLRLAVSRVEPIGGFTSWRPALPVTQWVWHKSMEGDQ